ncbi:type I polyketide synthase [Streptomyces sp. SID13588]|uniref:type I polyketide synthase n=1 Tax=Streptomyces sp. SID13588 TaxID=2706051 RepID=UPI0013CDA009|nr:type I polyketide synthase [Streptomyces sp. SID13588]NEA73798.1 acyltransferase domain-containing protein [Streptomyces sp. SID13588]
MSELPVPSPGPESIAVVAAACRLPGADNVAEFWELLRLGRDAVIREPANASDAGQPAPVRARGVLSDIDMFDAAFFGFSSVDARTADPQIRLLLEEGYHAYEASGRLGSRDRLGVFASCGMSTYLLNNVLPDPQATQDWTAVSSLNDKDFAATHLAYALDATGPAVSVQTACSSSLVALHLACESLLTGECDTTLVAGAGIHVPQLGPARTTPVALVAPDGHCRAFDADATGTVFGNGVVAVVLCRLEDVLPNDDVLAVVLGTAVNNDGRRKPGYLSPSVDGQRDCIVAALGASGVSPDGIGMVEAHGTGTPLGDPIELQALREAWDLAGATGRPCAIGSVKTNIGHTGEAAGLAGFLKAVLSVRHGIIPPSLHFAAGNPAFDWSDAAFYVPTMAVPWTDEQRVASVTSLGIGGTNAHVIIGSFAHTDRGVRASPRSEGPVVLRLSAASPASLTALAASTRTALEREPSALDPIVNELNHRRKNLPYRAAVSGRDAGEIATALRGVAQPGTARRVRLSGRAVFAFSGQGDVDTAGLRALMQQAELAAHLDRAVVGLDLIERSRLDEWSADHVDDSLAGRTDLVQPLLYGFQTFVVDQLVAGGISPSVVLGHSVGEIAALYAAGMIGLSDGMALAARRGAAMQRHSPAGAMATVLAGWEAVEGLVTGVVVAADNSTGSCALAGPDRAIDKAIKALLRHGIRARRLPVTRAFHSPSMVLAGEEMARLCANLPLAAPRTAMISTLTARPAMPTELREPGYWRDQAVQRVRFRDAMRCVDTDYPGPQTWFDIGLKPMVAHFLRSDAPPGLVGCLTADPSTLARSGVSDILAQAWALGLDITAPAARPPGAVRASLPYPFDRRSYWITAPLHDCDQPGRAPAEQKGLPFPGDAANTDMEMDEILSVVLAAWRDCLGLEHVDPAADFFEVGGHSLVMIALMANLERLFPAKRLPRMSDMLVVPTPRAMAELIGRAVSRA